jgi:hypothetical protein
VLVVTSGDEAGGEVVHVVTGGGEVGGGEVVHVVTGGVVVFQVLVGEE